MEFENNSIIFKSSPTNYEKEHTGLKCNTVRYISEAEGIRHTIKVWNGEMTYGYGLYIDTVQAIRIINSETGESFERDLTDITLAEINGLPVYVFSWEHPRTVKQTLDNIGDCWAIKEYLEDAGFVVVER